MRYGLRRQLVCKDEAMERRTLETAAARNTHLRGLFGIPLGLLIVLAALGNWEVGPLRHDWVFVACLIAIGAICLLINRYYNEHYGRATLSTRQQVRATVVAVIGAPLVFGVSLLARSRADWSLDLPVNAIAFTFALLMLASYATVIGLKTHHVIIWGGLFVVGALPVWNGADPSNIGLLLAGAGVMVTGVFDHRLFVQTFGPPRAIDHENGDVAAH
jgi:hypothetical protein